MEQEEKQLMEEGERKEKEMMEKVGDLYLEFLHSNLDMCIKIGAHFEIWTLSDAQRFIYDQPLFTVYWLYFPCNAPDQARESWQRDSNDMHYKRLQHLLQKSNIYSKFLLTKMEQQQNEVRRGAARPAAARRLRCFQLV